MEETVSKIHSENQMNIASAFQKSLLPDPGEIEGIEIAASYQPALDVGGDWYGYFRDSNTNTLDLFMGDVTGHGISAALLTAVSCGAVYSLEMVVERLGVKLTGEKRLMIMAKILDRVITQISGGRKYMSMVFMSLDLERGELYYLNAGHLPGFIINPEDHQVQTLLGPGTLLGSSGHPDDPRFSLRKTTLLEGDMIFLFTDGLIENAGPDGKIFKINRLRDSLACASNPGEALDTVLRKAKDVWQDCRGSDDVAMMAIRWNGNS